MLVDPVTVIVFLSDGSQTGGRGVESIHLVFLYDGPKCARIGKGWLPLVQDGGSSD